MQESMKAALYIRVSTEEQAIDGQSASAQAETLKQYCSAFGIEVYDIFMDLGISGKSLKNRHELNRLIEACNSGLFDMVLVWKISRLSRNLKDLLYLIDIFEKHNVHFASCSEKFDTSTPVGRMTLQLLGSIAEFERNTIIENVKLGLREFARKGGKSSAVFGYDNVGKSLIISENEAKIVRLIFRLYTEGAMNFSAIARHLNSLGYRTKRGREYRSSSIAYIIRNPVYIGINRHSMNTACEYSVQGSHPAIIGSELWSKAQSKNCRNDNGKAISTGDSCSSLFQVTCMKCRKPMKIFYSYSKGKKYKYFRCCNCSNYVNAEKLAKAVSCEIIALISDKAAQKSVQPYHAKLCGLWA
jgi:site-specific DNA recombinase